MVHVQRVSSSRIGEEHFMKVSAHPRVALLISALTALLISAAARATVLTGPGGQGVPVGQSSLIGTLDYSDTFTGTDDGSANPSRPYQPAIQPSAAYVVESTYGNASRNFV